MTATTTRPAGTRTFAGMNPWLATLWIITAITGLTGIGIIGANGDPDSLDYDPAAVALGHTVLGIGGVLLAGLLVAGAICWQVKQRR